MPVTVTGTYDGCHDLGVIYPTPSRSTAGRRSPCCAHPGPLSPCSDQGSPSRRIGCPVLLTAGTSCKRCCVATLPCCRPTWHDQLLVGVLHVAAAELPRRHLLPALGCLPRAAATLLRGIATALGWTWLGLLLLLSLLLLLLLLQLLLCWSLGTCQPCYLHNNPSRGPNSACMRTPSNWL